MRRAIWMALAFMGTAPLVALAQQNTGTAPAASPSGAGSLERGQDTTATQAPGSPGQQSAGSVGTAQGEPATGGAGAQGTTGQDGQQGLSGGTGAGTGGGAGAGTGETPSASPPADIGTRVGPEPGEQAGGGGTGTVGTGGGGTGGTGMGTGGTGTGSGREVGTGTGGGGTGGTGGGGGQSAMKQAPAAMGSEAMQRELTTLRERVARLEAEVDALRGTGGAGTGGDTGTPDTADVQVQGPVTVATAVFDGRVVDVTRKHIDIVDTSDGTFYRLTLDDQTRAFVGPDLERIPVEQLSEGTQVRTSFALISGAEHARNIVTQPRQQKQGSPQGQQGQAPRSQPPQRAPRR